MRFKSGNYYENRSGHKLKHIGSNTFEFCDGKKYATDDDGVAKHKWQDIVGDYKENEFMRTLIEKGLNKRNEW